MIKAFENWKELEKLESVEDKHKFWMEDYHGLQYSIAMNKTHQIKWQTDKHYYDMRKFNVMINCIARKKDRLVIEFDEVENEPDNASKALEEVKQKLIKEEIGFIQSTHKSKNSDYLWVEFTKQITTNEAKRFLKWVCPTGSRVDLNFTSDLKLFPVLFARHWKYSQTFELPIEFNEGNKVDLNSLDLPKEMPKEIITLDEDGFAYATYQAAQIFSPKGQAKTFAKAQPIFFDKTGMWWLWNPQKYYWETVDEVEILNMVEAATGQDVITPKNRTLIINSLKQKGRKMTPKEIKPTWIQFKNIIIDIETMEEIPATPKYFITNPIPWELEKENFATPNMDRIFTEWVGKENVELLYEILAYSILPDMPIHRIFCFIGEGMNGKSKFLELLRKFIGKDNCCSTELDVLLSSRFEVTRLHKKLVCQMGETNFNEMSKTSLLKKLSGGDLIGFEYKNKNPFEEKNYAKIIIATNNLPSTTDKTIGFYRRWTIIDFPNQFSEKKDILNDIPDEEYKSLATRCTVTLKSLLKNRSFTNEGTIKERMERYESKSNFLEKFIELNIKEDYDSYITKSSFHRKFGEWCKENRHRIMAENSVGRNMKKLGFEDGRRTLDFLNETKPVNARTWENIKWRD